MSGDLTQIGDALRSDGVRLHSNNQCNFYGSLGDADSPSVLRLSVQAEQCRCSCDPAASFDRVASSMAVGLESLRCNSAWFLLQCAKRKIHFATQHSPLERTFS
jgi:hypothetical protein